MRRKLAEFLDLH
jgi:hypothetical protein